MNEPRVLDQAIRCVIHGRYAAGGSRQYNDAAMSDDERGRMVQVVLKMDDLDMDMTDITRGYNIPYSLLVYCSLR